MRTLPFRDDMLDAIRAGRKTCTARTTRFGKPGDRLSTDVGEVVLTAVERVTLEQVRDVHWEQEGVDSSAAFERIWNEIHPRRGFDPIQKVWLHSFRLVS